MAKGQTIRQSVSGCPPGAEALVARWNESLVDNMLQLVWEAYDQLSDEFLRAINWAEEYDQLETSISMELERTISIRMNGYMPVRVQHAPYEFETRSETKRNAQSPQYDIAFFMCSDPRLMWPLEAKMLKSDCNTKGNIGDYIDTFNNRYLTCKYAPFSNSGAMIGYLKTGQAEVVIKHIAQRLGCSLARNSKFPGKCHRTSDHNRNVPPGKSYPSEFRCHHLVMPLDKGSQVAS